MAGGIILGVPPVVVDLNQKGLLERAFHDGLFPNLAFRAEALEEKWEANSGTEIYMTRRGLLKPKVKPNTPGVDPTPQAMPYEQWVARLDQYCDTIDTHVPTSVTANSDLFLSNIHGLGMQAGQSVNRIARNELFKAYLSGQTTLTAAAITTDTELRVSSVNGFTDIVNPGVTTRPAAPSTSNPLKVTVQTGVTKTTANVIGFTLDDPNDAFGPGKLQLSAALGVNHAARSSVTSQFAPRVVRSAAGTSVDAIGAGDTLTLQQGINAVAFLRDAGVLPHPETGFYHAHISPLAQAQVFADPVYQRLHQSLPDSYPYKTGFIGEIGGLAFFMNQECPNETNTGDRLATGVKAFYSPEIGAETTNENGVAIGRVIITGKGCIYEKWLDEGQYVTEAGVVGKIGEFQVVNNGVNILTERIRLILRAPLNRMQDKVAATWSITTSFPIPSDVTAFSGPQRFKRAIVLEHAL